MKSFLSLLLLLPTLCLAQPDDLFDHILLTTLRDEFASQAPVYSQDLLLLLQQRTGLSEAEIRQRLLLSLDALDARRSDDSSLWSDLTGLGGSDIPPAAAGKFLHKLIDESRTALVGTDNYLLDNILRQGARRARLRQFQSRDYLLQLLDWAITGSLQDPQAEDFGIVVSGHTNRFEIYRDPLFIFFDSQEEAFVMEQVREIQRFIIPPLVRRLPTSDKIRWAVRQRETNALVEPEYVLDFGVDNLSFTGSNRNLRPCIEATIDLLTWPQKSPVQTWQFQYCTEKHGSASTSELVPFYQEVADEVSHLVDDYLHR